jgi:hypothetical protein
LDGVSKPSETKCVTDVLSELRLPQGQAGARVTATIALKENALAQPSAAASTAATSEGPFPDRAFRYGSLHGPARVKVRGFRSPSNRFSYAFETERAATAVVAKCLAQHVHVANVAHRIQADVRVGPNGRVEEVELEESLPPALSRCLQDGLSSLAFSCPEGRQPRTVHLDACGFIDPLAGDAR